MIIRYATISYTVRDKNVIISNETGSIQIEERYQKGKTNLKKILLLGGSAQQVSVIEKAKKLGYYTILCDYLPDNPGQYAADKFYPVSTTDREAVLEVAEKEQVNGVLAYASDPAAPTAAYVAEKMELPGNPYQSVEILCNKDHFRKFLAENGFSTPKAKGLSSVTAALQEESKFEYPIIIKPVDSSGSKGATVLHTGEGMREALEFAFSFSRSHRIIIECFAEKKHPYLIGGDIFIEDGEIVLWGLLNCHRDANVNSLVPVGKSYPLQLEQRDVERVKNTLSFLVEKLGIRNGSMNVELVVDKSGHVWPIDIGPRSGGNMIPDLLGDMFGVDIAEMSVDVAMGKLPCGNIHEPDGYYATYNLHSDRDGLYKNVWFSPEIEPYIYRKCLYKKPGEPIEYFDNASKCLGIVFLKFPSQTVMKDVLDRVNDLIRIELRSNFSVMTALAKAEIDKVIRDCDGAFPDQVAERTVYPELLDKISEKGKCIYAYHEKVMGYCAFYANDSEQKNAFISLLAVRPEYQHMHIGADLLKAAFERMLSCGMKHCFLEVRKNNEAAKCFYEKMGLENVEEHGDKYLMKYDLVKCRLKLKNLLGGATVHRLKPFERRLLVTFAEAAA